MLSRRSFCLAASAPLLRAQMFADAEAYERFMGRWSRLLAPLLLDFAALPETGRFLDVGSGTGALAAEIALRKPAARVTGIDPSKEYVAFATARNPFPQRSDFETGDAQALPFPDRTFAAAVSLLVFNFIPDPLKAVREVRRVTRPGGPIAAAVWDYGERMVMLRLFWDAAVEIDPAAEKRDEKHMSLRRAGELAALWKHGGLTDVEERPLEISMNFRSFADFWEPFLLGQGPAGAYVRTLDRQRQEALRAAVERRLPRSAASGPFYLPARVWAVRGLA